MKKTNKNAWQFANLELPNRVIAAPMAGITTAAYRFLLKEYGAAMAVSEMISAQALIYDNQKTWQMLDTEGEPQPIVVQLAGHEPAVMAEAARLLCEKYAEKEQHIALIDLNMGCPAPKIVKNGDGAALSQNPKLACEIAAAVVSAVNVPVTVKLRLGWDSEHENYETMMKGLAQSGISAITLHARYRNQFYSGEANRLAIKKAVMAVEIPVIGNGDIKTPAEALTMLEETGCAAVMIGRGCIGNPWLIKDTVDYLAGLNPQGKPQKEEIISVACRHLAMEIAHAHRYEDDERQAEAHAVRAMRAHLGYYFKGLRGAAAMREKINHLDNFAEIKAYLEQSIHE